MDAGLVVAMAAAFAFALTNGFHDVSNAIATLVATRAARPGQAIVLAAVFNMLGRCSPARQSPTPSAGSWSRVITLRSR